LCGEERGASKRGLFRALAATEKGTLYALPSSVAFSVGAYFFLVAGFLVSTFFAAGFLAASFFVVAVAMLTILPNRSPATVVNARYRYREKHCQEKNIAL
jgi:hypothetical protein